MRPSVAQLVQRSVCIASPYFRYVRRKTRTKNKHKLTIETITKIPIGPPIATPNTLFMVMGFEWIAVDRTGDTNTNNTAANNPMPKQIFSNKISAAKRFLTCSFESLVTSNLSLLSTRTKSRYLLRRQC